MEIGHVMTTELSMELEQVAVHGRIVTPVSFHKWSLASDVNGPLNLSPVVYWLLVDDFDLLPSQCCYRFWSGVHRQLMLSVSDVHLVSCPEFLGQVTAVVLCTVHSFGVNLHFYFIMSSQTFQNISTASFTAPWIYFQLELTGRDVMWLPAYCLLCMCSVGCVFPVLPPQSSSTVTHNLLHLL